jgi:Holliday junction resolvase RusA-like endonuclease
VQNKIYRFNITPQTNVRAVQGDRIFFRIPREKLQQNGLRRLLRLERYNKYKEDIRAVAREQHFTFPHQGACIRFYIPCPKTWSKKKKAQHHNTLHYQRPDIDNCIKAILDSLFTEDKAIGHIEASKHWINFDAGWIEIELKKPVFPSIPHPEKKAKSAQ